MLKMLSRSPFLQRADDKVEPIHAVETQPVIYDIRDILNCCTHVL
jgi:hypothetical protein